MKTASRIPLLVALLAFGVSLLISWAALDRIPHVTDEVSYLFQGRLLASGRVCPDPPPVSVLFAMENVIRRPGTWCSLYPPGWPLLLAIGWLVGAPWLMSPLLLGLSVVGVWVLGRKLFDARVGVLAAVALAASPFALVMGAGFMSHTASLCAVVWCMAALAGGAESARPKVLLAAGLLGGYAFLIRPYTAVVLLAPFVLWCLFRLRRDRRWLPALGWMALGALPCVVGFLLYNQAAFGHPLTTGYQAYNESRFGQVESMALSPAEALRRNLPWYLENLGRALWGWPWPSFLIFLPLLWPRPGRGRDALLFLCAAGLVLAYCGYYWRDVIYAGPRFAFEALGPLSVLAARALLTLVEGLDHLLGPGRRTLRLAILGLGAVVLLVFPLGRRLPEQILHHSGWYLAVSAEPLRKAAEAGVGPDALVFVSGTPWCYSGFFLENAIPPQEGRRVYVRDIPPLRGAALKAYGRPEVWLARVIVEIPDRVNAPDIARPVEVSWRRLR